MIRDSKSIPETVDRGPPAVAASSHPSPTVSPSPIAYEILSAIAPVFVSGKTALAGGLCRLWLHHLRELKGDASHGPQIDGLATPRAARQSVSAEALCFCERPDLGVIVEEDQFRPRHESDGIRATMRYYDATSHGRSIISSDDMLRHDSDGLASNNRMDGPVAQERCISLSLCSS